MRVRIRRNEEGFDETPASGKTVAAGSPRQGKKVIAGFFDPAVSRQLKEIGLNADASVQDLLRDALNGFFVKHGKKAIA